MNMAPLPDPVAFAADALGRAGAVLEPSEVGIAALVPSDVSKRLALPEEILLSTTGAPGTVSCALGTELLDRLVAEARAETPTTAAALRLPPPKLSHGKGLAERYVVRNGVSTAGEAHGTEALYAVGWISFVAEADERHEGVVRAIFDARDGSQPDAAFAVFCDPLFPDLLEPKAHVFAANVTDWFRRYGSRAVEAAIEPIRAGTERRHARDHARIVEYYAALMTEARGPRRKVDAAAIEAKLAHLMADRDAKLRDLAHRFLLRVSERPAGVMWLLAPAIEVTLHVKRRKATRDVVLRLPAGANELDALPCEGCAGVTSHPAFCDDAMHLLCERCVPNVSGRPDCPACARK